MHPRDRRWCTQLGQEIYAENFSPWGLADLHLPSSIMDLCVNVVSARASGWGGWLGQCWDLRHGVVHAGQCWWEGKIENVKETGWVLDAFIFQHIPILHNSKVNALGGRLTKTSSSSVKCLATDQLFIEIWRQLIWMHLCKFVCRNCRSL